MLSRVLRIKRKKLSAKEHLEAYGAEYPWRAMWLKHGKIFQSPSRLQCLRMRMGGGLMALGHCYGNTLRLAHGMDGYIVSRKDPEEILYCEGYAVNHTGGYLHAWLLVDGEVYDPTWPDGYRASYFGITFDPDWVLKFANETGWVSFLQNWSTAIPYLRSLFGEELESA